MELQFNNFILDFYNFHRTRKGVVLFIIGKKTNISKVKSNIK